jgi:hypothetical protein
MYRVNLGKQDGTGVHCKEKEGQMAKSMRNRWIEEIIRPALNRRLNPAQGALNALAKNDRLLAAVKRGIKKGEEKPPGMGPDMAQFVAYEIVDEISKFD